MAIKIPPSLKLLELKSLAFQCGVSTSGSKTLLTSRLIDEFKFTQSNYGIKKSPRTRVLSIDMGIRNLAYCILDLESYSIEDPKPSLPNLQAWQRVAVSSRPALSQETEPTLSVAKEAFDPQTLSIAAYALLRYTLLPHNPTHILIERQRFRSMGSPHILEWTIRVNMFESMLYAVLQTLKSEKIWNGSVIPIAPGKVGPFWIEPKGTAAQELLPRPPAKLRNTKSAKLLNKGAKIDLVGGWLETKQKLDLGTVEVEKTARAYVEKWHRLPGRTKGKKTTSLTGLGEMDEMGKLDDLADSLLQGMAWIQWEKNKIKVLKNGIGALDFE